MAASRNWVAPFMPSALNASPNLQREPARTRLSPPSNTLPETAMLPGPDRLNTNLFAEYPEEHPFLEKLKGEKNRADA